MTSRLRNCEPGLIYHVLNRGVKRQRLFGSVDEYHAFESLIQQTLNRTPLTLFTYQLLPNHWHFVVRPHRKDDLSEFFKYLSGTHAKQFHAQRDTTGEGHVYQDRFKSFPVQDDGHFLALARYVERNALSAGLVERAEQWRWSGLWRRIYQWDQWLTSDWPVRRPTEWSEHVNRALTSAETEAIRHSVQRGCPFGSVDWVQETVEDLGLQHTIRSPGRPPLCRTSR